jgi:ribonuclease E
MDSKSNKMLIDATHPEETRVVVLRNGRVEEFDYENAARKPLRGNIYLAKVTRVEPSLQAAFVEYGGNRHGFLAFSEIHPDYYQIPMADRQALLDEEFAAELEADAEADARAERRQQRQQQMPSRNEQGDNGDANGDRDEDRQDEQNPSGDNHDDHDRDDDRQHDQSHDHDHDHDHDHSHGELNHRDQIAESGHESRGHPAHSEAAEQTRSSQSAESHGLADPLRTESVDRDDHSHSETAHDHDQHADHQSGISDERDHGHHDEDREPERETARRGNDNEENGDESRGNLVEVADSTEAPEIISGEGEAADDGDALEELPERPRRQRRRQYKIQEVIKRRQIILVQVVKEERGNKGAALTTYLSLAGRYTVLMPNTGRGGGISRKITQAQDRKRLKSIAQELDVPEGMGLIIRTAGASRTKQEIRRDYEYLLRLWESVRDLTLESTAPSLVYEEGNLIKRSIRDQYTKDVDEIVVAGAHAHREAQDFMRMLMPSHAKNVLLHDRPEPLFSRYPVVERQLNAMFSPFVTLKSGGYLVINQTEALVAIDINSGKSTREFSIEETALNTNLEAADEIARQLKLRDLAGLIVIDFIDMEERRNNRKVESRVKDALRHDRARIQVGRISHFGLLEMSRQRMRTGVLEGSTSQCPHCQGTGIIRSVESVALAVLRGLEDHLQRDNRSSVSVATNAEVALYILNNKRAFIIEMERRYGVAVAVVASDRMQGANFAVERSAAPLLPKRLPERAAVNMNWGFDGKEGEVADSSGHADEEDEDDPRPATVADARGEDATIDEIDDQSDLDEDGEEPRGAQGGSSGNRQDDGKGRKRRRRGRGRGRDDDRGGQRPERSERNDRGDRGDRQQARPAEAESGRRVERDSAAPRSEHDEVDVNGSSDYSDDQEVGREKDVEGAEGDARSNASRVGNGEREEGGRGRRRRRGRRGGRRGRTEGDAPTAEADGDTSSEARGNGDESMDDSPSHNQADRGDEVRDHIQMASGAPESRVEREAHGVRQVDDEHEAQHEMRQPEVSEPKPEAPARRETRPRVREHAPVEAEASRADAVADTVTAERPVPPSQAIAEVTPEPTPTPTPIPRARNTTPPEAILVESSNADAKPAKRGWWQRRILGE